MTDLNGRVALVAGGAGAVGEGIVRALLDAGATVAVPSRAEERLRSLRERLGQGGRPADPDRLVTVEGDVGSADDALRVRDRILTAAGRLDAVVVSAGGWWQGPHLVDVEPETWHRVLDANLTTHFTVARAFLPVVRDQPGASYLMIVGDAADHPVKGASLVTVTSAGVLGMFRSLVHEHRDHPVRINALYLGPLITRDRPEGKPEWLTAGEVGSYAAHLAGDQAAMVSGSVVPLLGRPPQD